MGEIMTVPRGQGQSLHAGGARVSSSLPGFPMQPGALFSCPPGAYTEKWLQHQKLIPASAWPKIGRG